MENVIKKIEWKSLLKNVIFKQTQKTTSIPTLENHSKWKWMWITII